MVKLGCNVLIDAFNRIQDEHGSQNTMKMEFERNGKSYVLILADEVGATRITVDTEDAEVKEAGRI